MLRCDFSSRVSFKLIFLSSLQELFSLDFQKAFSKETSLSHPTLPLILPLLAVSYRMQLEVQGVAIHHSFLLLVRTLPCFYDLCPPLLVFSYPPILEKPQSIFSLISKNLPLWLQIWPFLSQRRHVLLHSPHSLHQAPFFLFLQTLLLLLLLLRLVVSGFPLSIAATSHQGHHQAEGRQSLLAKGEEANGEDFQGNVLKAGSRKRDSEKRASFFRSVPSKQRGSSPYSLQEIHASL